MVFNSPQYKIVSLQQPSKTAVLNRRAKSNKLVTNKKQIQFFIPTTVISLYRKANGINYSNKLINMTFQEMQNNNNNKNKIKSQLKTGNKANTDIKLSQLILFTKRTIHAYHNKQFSCLLSHLLNKNIWHYLILYVIIKPSMLYQYHV
jgi:hypothetical protein